MTKVSDIKPDTPGTYSPQEFKPVELKKPTREFCKTELRKRLMLKRGAPRDERELDMLKYVLDALVQVAEDESHVLRIVAECEQRDYFPDGYVIRQIAGATKGTERRPNPKCEKCDGSGFLKPVEKGGYTGVPTTADGKPLKCDCWRTVERV